MQRTVTPVAWHLATTRVRVSLRAYSLIQHLFRRHAERQHQRPIPVVGKEVVVARTQEVTSAYERHLMTGTRDLKVDLVLPLHRDLAVIQAPRGVHRPVHPHDRLRRQPQLRSLCRKPSAGTRRRILLLRVLRDSHLDLAPRLEPAAAICSNPSLRCAAVYLLHPALGSSARLDLCRFRQRTAPRMPAYRTIRFTIFPTM